MKILTVALPSILAVTAAAVVLPITMRAASGHDFEDVVSAVQTRYSVKAERVPMMGFVSLCAHVATGGGVKGMKIAEFDNLPKAPEPGEFESLVRVTLGSGWQPFVTERSNSGEVNIIYVQPDGESVRMFIANYEHGELDLVRMELNADRLAKFEDDPAGNARRHNFAISSNGNAD